jgi:hypothetical protein
LPPPDDRKDPHQPAGRVRHDSTGRAVWEWAADTGRHALDSTSRLLKRLDLPGLKLAEDEKKEEEATPPPAGTDSKPKVPTFGGPREADPLAHSKHSFNPYDNRAPPRRTAVPAQKPGAKPGTKPSPRVTQPLRPAKKAGFFARLFGAAKK